MGVDRGMGRERKRMCKLVCTEIGWWSWRVCWGRHWRSQWHTGDGNGTRNTGVSQAGEIVLDGEVECVWS